jgi:asparagine synthase (glutamine-hydrolysing)
MCGIAGIVGGNSDRKQALNRMIKSIHHRGPDDSGVYADDDVAIGMTRLAILDLSPLGHQPMQSHDGRYWIVFNGEVYNYREIRAKLEQTGDRFVSDSDTEVVLQAYCCWGEMCLREFNGMFGFAIWDTLEKKLFAARDHLGIKPFYYYTSGNGSFIFGSEIKTLLSSGLVKNNIDREAVFQYFTFGHIQQPKTILQDVKAIMPGHCLTWKQSKISIKRYWSLSAQPVSTSYNEAKELVLEQINRSVKMQLVSDRPLGLFLSGGLDSASVLAAMHASGASIRTFSIGFEENPFAKNEAKEAEELARHFNAAHNQIMVDAGMVERELMSFWKALDQPSVDGLNTYLVSKYASEHMTVALSGLGGDELFAGYSRHARILWKLANANPMSGIVNAMLPQRLLKQKGTIGRWSYRVKQNVDRSVLLRNYTYSRSMGSLSDSLRVLSDQMLGEVDVTHSFINQYQGLDWNVNSTNLNEILALDIQGFMESVLLRDMDATSMWHSLEVRFPLIDYKLVELAFSLPDVYKLNYSPSQKPQAEGKLSYRDAGNKKILMDAMEQFLPAGFANRPKNGFKLPISHWLKSYKREELKAMVMDESNLWGPYLNPHKIEGIFNTNEGNNNLIWKVLCFVKTIHA